MSVFSERLKMLGYRSYDEYLESDYWKEFKARFKASGREVCCAVCGSMKRPNHHHHTYVRMGAELFSDIDILCGFHHKQVHEWLDYEGWPVENTHIIISRLRIARQDRQDRLGQSKKKWKIKKSKKAKRPKKVRDASPEAKSARLAGEIRMLVKKIGPEGNDYLYFLDRLVAENNHKHLGQMISNASRMWSLKRKESRKAAA